MLNKLLIFDRTSMWMEKMIKYLRDEELPSDNKEVKKVKTKAKWFTWHDENLYKKSYTHPLLKCVTPEDGEYILREIHEGACGSHQGSRTIAATALQVGYYWPTLKKDTMDLVRKFPKCHLFSNLPRTPAIPLTSIQVVFPFDKWGMDLLGPFSPASSQRKFLIVAIDYFTKWIEGKPLATITDKQVQMFIWRNIITRFRVPKTLVSDNGRQFNSGPTRDYCDRFGISTRFSTVLRPRRMAKLRQPTRLF